MLQQMRKRYLPTPLLVFEIQLHTIFPFPATFRLSFPEIFSAWEEYLC
jgi:hypothetical protein